MRRIWCSKRTNFSSAYYFLFLIHGALTQGLEKQTIEAERFQKESFLGHSASRSAT